MKILVIGDPHGNLAKVKQMPLKQADLILLTGDLGKADLARKNAFKNIERKKQGLPELKPSKSLKKRIFAEVHKSSMNILNYCSKFAPTYFIYGNVEQHDRDTKKTMRKEKIKLPLFEKEVSKIKNVKIVNNKLINLKGIRIGALEYFIDVNWVKDFKPSDYKKRMNGAIKDSNKAKKLLKKFNKVDILLHHQPPYGVLDKVTNPHAPKHWQGLHAGSKVILDYIKRKQPTYAFCGHIHEGEGQAKIGKTLVYNLGVASYKLIEL